MCQMSSYVLFVAPISSCLSDRNAETDSEIEFTPMSVLYVCHKSDTPLMLL